MFDGWRSDLEKRLRSDDLHPALESHLAKYRKLVPALALLNYLADHGTLAIKKDALERACRFARYLESHARRAYGAGIQNEVSTGKAIMEKVWKGSLKDGFTARDITHNEWSQLTDGEQVGTGLNLLVDHGWLAQQEVKTGGRAKLRYFVNPATFTAA
jgi:putative DNA primase/helicase